MLGIRNAGNLTDSRKQSAGIIPLAERMPRFPGVQLIGHLADLLEIAAIFLYLIREILLDGSGRTALIFGARLQPLDVEAEAVKPIPG